MLEEAILFPVYSTLFYCGLCRAFLVSFSHQKFFAIAEAAILSFSPLGQ